jgi:hypothetical protein
MTNLPVSGEFTITAIYGQQGKYWANGHKGIDFVASNPNIYATCDGVVRVIGYDPSGWGQYVSIGDNEGRRHIFCHLKKGVIRVKEGQKVNRTTLIGLMGDTGNVSGVHLHYQINDANNIPVDPTTYLGIPNKKGTYDSADYQIGEDDMKFKDEAKIADWAKEAVDKVSDEGIMVGDANGKFNPKSSVTREELAVVIAKMLNK